MKNRILLCFVLSACLILCMFSVPTFAVENALSFEGDTIAQAGDTVEISLKLDKNPGVISLSLDISYDKEGLSLKSVEDTKLLKGFNSSPAYDKVYPYTLFWIDGTATKDNSSTGVVAKLTFEVLKSGKHKVEAKCNLNDTCNFKLDSVDFKSTSHIIEVNGEEPPEGGGEIPPEGGDEPPSGGDIIPPDDNDPEEDEEPDDPVISPSTPTVELTKAVDGEVEDEVTLSIDIKNNPGIISAQFYVDYDKDALTLVNVENSGLLKGFESSPDYQNIYPYSLFWLEGTAATNNKSNGTIAKLTFKIKKAGNHTVKVTCEPRNTNNFLFDDIDFGNASGVVNAVMGERIKVTVNEKADEYLINVKVKNMTDAAFIYVAGYSDNGRMLAVRMADENGNTDFSKELSIDYFKTFLWSAQEIPLDMAVITNLD